MDIVAHGLWAGIGIALARRKHDIPRETALATIGAAMAPDLIQLMPVLFVAVSQPDGMAVLRAYIMALPGFEPALAPWVEFLTHHLHCAMHSAVVAGVVTAAAWWLARSIWLPLLGWWSHIVIDVFTHSAEFYPVPVLYPFTQRGFDGLAWNEPWFLVANYLAIAIALTWLLVTRRGGRRPSS
jgi:hypothetical protein